MSKYETTLSTGLDKSSPLPWPIPSRNLKRNLGGMFVNTFKIG